MGLTPDFETRIQTPLKQPVFGIVPVTGCLVLFDTDMVIISNVAFDSLFYDGSRSTC